MFWDEFEAKKKVLTSAGFLVFHQGKLAYSYWVYFTQIHEYSLLNVVC